jgi:holo-[acyl-carrier protein] synthase
MAVLILWDLVLMENNILKIPDAAFIAKNFAVGNDLVFVPGFQATFNDLFKKKVYTPNEIAYCDQFSDSLLRYASTWAAKEAVYKAVKQIDPSTLGWNKIEILRSKPAGEPRVIIHKEPGNFKISLTISHDGDYVWAIAFIDTTLRKESGVKSQEPGVGSHKK